MCLRLLRSVCLLAAVAASSLGTSSARTVLGPDERLHVSTIIAKLTKVKGGQHGSFDNTTAPGAGRAGTSGTGHRGGKEKEATATAAGVGVASSAEGLDAGQSSTEADNSELLSLLGAPKLSVHPPFFHFGSHYTCISTSQDFELTNISPNANETVEIYSVTTSSLHFHISNFSPTTLAANKTKAVRVMFLPYREGPVSAVVVIQTSLGGFLLRLSGDGVRNPYGVKGFTGVRIPMGIAYNPAVQVYNPFDETLLIKEIFTTEGFLHLTLPDFVADMDKVEEVNAVSTSASIWQVQPREMKDVIELSFRSHTPGPYRGFLHIKTNLDNLVVPVDIMVLAGGIHAMPEQLQFGATIPGEVHTIPITLLNSDRFPVAILDVSTRNIDDSISISYESGFVLLPQKSISGAINVSLGWRRPAMPDFENSTTTTATAAVPSPEDEVSGFIVIRTNQSGNAITKIPYSALFLKGSIGFDEEQLMFPLFKTDPQAIDGTIREKDTASAGGSEDESKAGKALSAAAAAASLGGNTARGSGGLSNHTIFTNRTIRLVNNFGIPLAMRSITLPDSHFGVTGLMMGSVAQPGEAWPSFSLHFHSGCKRLIYNTTLILHTNVTMHRIPIQVYHGLLDITTEPNTDPTPTPALRESGDEVLAEGAAGDSDDDDDKYFIDFGVIATNETRRRILNLSNPNPIPITVYRISKSWRALHLRLAGIYLSGANESANASYHKGSGLFVLEPHAVTSFVVILKAPQRERSAQARAAINFYTSSGQIRVGAQYEAVHGQLIFTPTNLRFDSAFPGLVLRKSIFATNTYPHPLRITNVESMDPRIIVQYITNATLPANVRSLIAEVLFDPSRACTVDGSGIVVRDEDYSSSTTTTSLREALGGGEDGALATNPNQGRDGLVSSFHTLEHMRGFRITPDAISDPTLALSGRPGCIDLLPYQYDTKRQFLIEEDVKALELRDINWAKQQASGQTRVRTALRIDSTIMTAQSLPVRATLTQPGFVTGPLDFGIVHTGKFSSLYVEVHNPASLAVQIQLVAPFDQFHMDEGAGHADGVIDADGAQPARGASTGSQGFAAAAAHRHVHGAEAFWLDEETAGGRAHRSIVMEPFTTSFLGPIRFRPREPELYVDTFYLRNNLTGVATVTVKGKGGRGELSLYDDGIFIPNLQQYLTAKAAAEGTQSEFAEPHSSGTTAGSLKLVRFEIGPENLNGTRSAMSADYCSKSAASSLNSVVAGRSTGNCRSAGLVKTLRVWNRGTLPMRVVDVSFLPTFFAPRDALASARRGHVVVAGSAAFGGAGATTHHHYGSQGHHPDVDELYPSLSLLQRLFVNWFYRRNDGSLSASSRGGDDGTELEADRTGGASAGGTTTSAGGSEEGEEEGGGGGGGGGEEEEEEEEEEEGEGKQSFARRFGSCASSGFEIIDCEAQFGPDKPALEIPSKGSLDLHVRLVPDCMTIEVETVLQIRVQDGQHHQLLYAVQGVTPAELMPACRDAAQNDMSLYPTTLSVMAFYLCLAILVAVLIVTGREVYQAAVVHRTMYGCPCPRNRFEHAVEAASSAPVVGSTKTVRQAQSSQHSQAESLSSLNAPDKEEDEEEEVHEATKLRATLHDPREGSPAAAAQVEKHVDGDDENASAAEARKPKRTNEKRQGSIDEKDEPTNRGHAAAAAAASKKKKKKKQANPGNNPAGNLGGRQEKVHAHHEAQTSARTAETELATQFAVVRKNDAVNQAAVPKPRQREQHHHVRETVALESKTPDTLPNTTTETSLGTAVSAAGQQRRQHPQHKPPQASPDAEAGAEWSNVTRSGGSDGTSRKASTRGAKLAKIPQQATHSARAPIRRSKSDKERLELARREMWEMERLRRQENEKALQVDANRIIEKEKARKAASALMRKQGNQSQSRGWDQRSRDPSLRGPKQQSELSARVAAAAAAANARKEAAAAAAAAQRRGNTRGGMGSGRVGTLSSGKSFANAASRATGNGNSSSSSSSSSSSRSTMPNSVTIKKPNSNNRAMGFKQSLSAPRKTTQLPQSQSERWHQQPGAKSVASAQLPTHETFPRRVVSAQLPTPPATAVIRSVQSHTPNVGPNLTSNTTGSAAANRNAPASIPAVGTKMRPSPTSTSQNDFLARLRAGRSLSIDDDAEETFNSALASSVASAAGGGAGGGGSNFETGSRSSTSEPSLIPPIARSLSEGTARRKPMRPSPILAAVLSNATDEPVDDLGLDLGLDLGNLIGSGGTGQRSDGGMLSPITNNSSTYRSPPVNTNGAKPKPIGAPPSPVGATTAAGSTSNAGAGRINTSSFSSAFSSGPAFGNPPPSSSSSSSSSFGGSLASAFGSSAFGTTSAQSTGGVGVGVGVVGVGGGGGGGSTGGFPSLFLGTDPVFGRVGSRAGPAGSGGATSSAIGSGAPSSSGRSDVFSPDTFSSFLPPSPQQHRHAHQPHHNPHAPNSSSVHQEHAVDVEPGGERPMQNFFDDEDGFFGAGLGEGSALEPSPRTGDQH